jgi:hypothetical protein
MSLLQDQCFNFKRQFYHHHQREMKIDFFLTPFFPSVLACNWPLSISKYIHKLIELNIIISYGDNSPITVAAWSKA